jgi:hypothetical protein
MTDHYEMVLHDHGLNAQTATAEEKSLALEVATLALEVATLRRIIGHGTAAHDSRTLRNIQEQRNKIVAAVLRMIDHDDDWGYVRADILDAAREFRRITGGEP